MRYLSFSHGGEVSFGCVVGNAVTDLKRRSRLPDLASYIALNASSLGKETDLTADYALADIRYLPVIPNPSKVLCVATNYWEAGNEGGERPDYPLTFSRFAASQTGHGEALLKSDLSEKFDYEGELAVIIGKAGRRIGEADALSYVAGYSCFNDGSMRDWQKHSTQFMPGKNFFRTGGFGPWMVSADEISNPTGLSLRTRVNGELRQSNDTSRLIFSIPWLISYFSQFTLLEPGDVIVTGTPNGFGSTRTPPVFLADGDTVEVEITGIGTLSNTVTTDSGP
ncbi:2-keto-4-pentenoate hydratase/2-oxohepta-3-ene-1,7-dioic acid hydratase (catechol pathway) [Rhizobium hainanense]|uniref:2-keto-4-pentenoate hydratase/2-oxohepta-3-ene-1,7-dioic acid hydratase (Catechol pathway) n=1 Tax=Rhizobium hainanense TaxID=52131 RepID=A0A1C3W894_9HYPH|nr:fumarylacetoacetate hydrolase family protein [Rhizobium hainanense]SCB36193.1 2-keto-4-pentenoate hydratase/2-oxohepta-3-ene-1,7-dioic acid hydratase (catechol pathway) [Rhizobium hainanense]